MKKISAYHLILSFLLVTIVIFAFFYGLTYHTFQMTISESIEDSVNLKVMRNLEEILFKLENLENDQKGFVITGEASNITGSAKEIENIRQNLQELQGIGNKDTSYSPKIRRLSLVVNDKIHFIQSQIALVKEGKQKEVVMQSGSKMGLALMDSIEQQIFSLEERGRLLLKKSASSKKEISEKANQRFTLLGIMALLVLPVFYFRIRYDLKGRIIAEKKLRGFNEELSKKIDEQTVKLRDTNERYELIAHATNDAIWDWDIQTNIIRGNKTFYELYNVDPEKSSPDFNTFLEKIHPEDKDRVLKKFNEVIEKKISQTSDEFRFKTRDDTYRFILDRAYLLYDDKDHAKRMVGAMMDITDQKNAEEIIRQNEFSLNEAQRIAHVGSWELDITNSSLKWSDETYRIFELDPKKFGSSYEAFFDTVHPDDREMLNKAYFDSIKEKTKYDVVHRLKFPDGRIKFVHEQAETFYNKEGEPVRLLGTVQDITESKRAEESIKASEAKYRAFFESSMDGILLTTTDGKVYAANPAACSILGMTEEEICKAGRNGIADISDPRLVQLLKERAVNGNAKGELTLLRKDGTKIPVEISSTIFKDANAGEKTNMMFRDITQRKKAEDAIVKEKELSDSIINSLPGIFYLYDEMGTFLRWNKNFETVSGYDTEEMSQLNPLDFFDADEKELLQEKINEVFEKGVADTEAHFFTKNKEKIPYYFNGRKVIFEGKPCLIGVGIDITESKRAEEEVIRSKEELRLLSAHMEQLREEERTNIARDIHDELGQQLTVLKMDISWLNKKLTTNDPIIKQKTKELEEMADDTIKTVRRISSELRPSLLDNLGLVAALEWQSREFEKRTGIKTRFAAEAPFIKLPDKIATGLFRIFQESLTNVARHAQATSIHLSLKIENNKILMSINDNGKGFVPGNIKNKETLGILGMRERALILGGKYIIQSEPGEGTMVKVIIPIDNSDKA